MEFLLLFLLWLPLSKTAEPDGLLRAYMRDAVAQQLSNDALAEKYFCTSMLHRSDASGTKARKSMQWALTTQRDQLRTQQVNAEQVTFAAYDALPASQIPPKPFHMLSETKQVYVAQFRGEIVSYFLLRDGKIASTLLLGQGNEHYFIDFCR